MAFRPLKEVVSSDLKKAVILNSATIAVGDAIQPGASAANSEFADVATSVSALILGVVVGIEGKNGAVLEKSTVTVASDNQTVGKIKAVYIPAYIDMEYEADLDDTIAVTTGSDGVGFMNLKDKDELDEATYVIFSGTAGQFKVYGQGSNSRKVVGRFNKVI